MKALRPLLPGVVLLCGLTASNSAGAQALTTYRVTITNLTRGQVFSPPIVVSHTRDVALFRQGVAAIPELVTLAEDGDPSELAALLADLEEVFDIAISDGPVPPGASVTVEVDAAFPHSYVSAAGMLVTTNDAFFGLDSLRVPLRRDVEVAMVSALDAGSEANNEDCDFIPGPPCMNPFQRAPQGAEGFVHVHAGIHDGGDLSSSSYDWRNPVARVLVQRAE